MGWNRRPGSNKEFPDSPTYKYHCYKCGCKFLYRDLNPIIEDNMDLELCDDCLENHEYKENEEPDNE